MLMFFQYNWQVREDWFDWCESLSDEELLAQREGGVGGFLRTLFHIVDVEHAWIRGLEGESEFHFPFEEYRSLQAIRNLSASCRPKVESFVRNWSEVMEDKKLDEFTYGEILRHVIAHEIHHIGQLSIWARQMGIRPVTANLIGRGLVERT